MVSYPRMTTYHTTRPNPSEQACCKCGSRNTKGKLSDDGSTVTITCRFCNHTWDTESNTHYAGTSWDKFWEEARAAIGKVWEGKPSRLVRVVNSPGAPDDMQSRIWVGTNLKKMWANRDPRILGYRNGGNRNIYKLDLT